ncbi:CaiB/BaiF CoA transferase family protein [Chloroflexota bacterium]
MPKKLFEGLKVADFTWVYAGPIATKMFAVYGAEVVKIETSTATMTQVGQVEPSYEQFNTNKLSLTLNLAKPEGVGVAKKLVAWADIVAQNMGAGAMERIGLGYEELRKVKPDIIMLSLSLQGQNGPHAAQIGFGNLPTYLAGINEVTGWPDREAGELGPYADFIAPPFCVLAVLAALEYRRRTGKGQHIDLSMLEASIQFMAPIILDYTANRRVAKRMGNRLSNAAPHGAYRCHGEDRWCAIAVFTDEEWESFRKVIGTPSWTNDRRFDTLPARKENEDALDQLVEEWTINQSAEEVMTAMQTNGVAAGVLQNFKDLCHDPQLEHRHFSVNTEQSGENGWFRLIRPHLVLSKSQCEVRRSPMLGEHNEYVLKNILCMSDDEISELVIGGVIG